MNILNRFLPDRKWNYTVITEDPGRKVVVGSRKKGQLSVVADESTEVIAYGYSDGVDPSKIRWPSRKAILGQ